MKGHNHASITYTFSTVGNPKGIVIDHRAFVDGARIVSNYLNISEDDVISGTLSFNVDYGFKSILQPFIKSTLSLNKFILPEKVLVI